MEPTIILYTLLGASALVGVDASLSSSKLFLQTSVASTYEQQGFSQDMVEGIIKQNLNDIADTYSIEGQITFLSGMDKPLSSELAEVVGLSDALEAAKATVGLSSAGLRFSVIAGNQKSRIIVNGKKIDGGTFTLITPFETTQPLEDALRDASFQAMIQISPYHAILYAFDSAEKENKPPTIATELVSAWLETAPTMNFSPERARFENLKGIAFLISGDTAAAEQWFSKAMTSDPEFMPSTLNLSFMYLYRGDYARSIELIEPLAATGLWASAEEKLLAYAANILLGNALSNLGRFTDADEHYSKALQLRPQCVSCQLYRARSLAKRGRLQDAKATYALAEKAVRSIDNFEELAPLYFWLPAAANEPLVRLTGSIPPL